MSKFYTVVLYTLWIVSLIGVLVITFTNFRHPDMNLIVGVLFLFAVINSLLTLKGRK